MSEESTKTRYLEPNQVILLPHWARATLLGLLALLALMAMGVAFSLINNSDRWSEITPLMSIAQTAAGGAAIILFVLFAEKNLSTEKLHDKTDEFLEKSIYGSLKKIEIPQIKKGCTINVNVLKRAETIHGGRKDIYGANYDIFLNDFTARMWVGINVKRLSVIYFMQAESAADADRFKEIFRFTFGGAAKIGYETNFEYAEIEGEKIVSVWSTVMGDNIILVNPAEQLFWVQDIAMMTQSVLRTAFRHGLKVHTNVEPGPL